jgi:hypothetical protein
MVIAPACCPSSNSCHSFGGLRLQLDSEDSTPPQSQTAARARGGRSSQDGFSQQQKDGPLFLPKLNCLHEAFHVRGEDASNVAVTPIPTQNILTNHMLKHLKPSPRADLRGLTTRREALPSPTTAHRRHCWRGLV